MTPAWVTETLEGLRQVPGVLGSLVVGQRGELLARDLPEILPPDAARKITQRVVELLQIAGESLGSIDSLALDWPSASVGVFPSERCSLVVLSAPQTREDTVRLAARLAVRKLTAGMASGGAPVSGPPSRPSRPLLEAPLPERRTRGIWGD